MHIKGQLVELPTISDSFYTAITNDHIYRGEGRGWWGAMEVAGFSMCGS